MRDGAFYKQDAPTELMKSGVARRMAFDLREKRPLCGRKKSELDSSSVRSDLLVELCGKGLLVAPLGASCLWQSTENPI